MSAFTRQEGGDHYKSMPIEPIQFIHRNGLGFIEGSIIKYICRWRRKGGLEDLRKARHCVELLLELASEEAAKAAGDRHVNCTKELADGFPSGN